MSGDGARFFLRHALRQKRVVALTAGVLALDALVGIALPLPLRFAIDGVLVPRGEPLPPALAALVAGASPEARLAAAAAAMAVVYALSVWVTYAQTIGLQHCGNGFVLSVRAELTELYRAGAVRPGEKTPVDLVSRASQDAGHLEDLLTSGLPALVRALPSYVMILAMLLWTDWRIAALVSAALLVSVALILRYSRLMRRFRKAARHQETRFEAATLALVSGGAADGASLRWRSEAIASRLLDMSRAEAWLSGSTYGLKLLLRLLVVAVGGFAVLRGRATVGILVMTLSYLDSLWGATSDVCKFAIRTTKSFAGAERIAELLARPGCPPPRPAGPAWVPVPQVD